MYIVEVLHPGILSSQLSKASEIFNRQTTLVAERRRLSSFVRFITGNAHLECLSYYV